ncbi:MAG: methylmalonyl-CoA mutase [Candidatus Dadabacteria bacterium]|nr:MAG: methylmalonyl-CoA mutase [Candidatus Dadabacteria bacterium]
MTERQSAADRFAAWEKDILAPALERFPERRERFETISGLPLKRVYTPLDRAGIDPFEQEGLPGDWPYTRGPQPSMYRGRLWTMRQFAGFGSPEDTNARFKYLLSQGMTGLSTAFDMPTLMGYDADHPLAEGEVGKEGVSVSSLRDMEVLFDGIPLDQVTTSMTINAPAIILMAMYVAVARKQGVPSERIGGTIQNDMLKEFIAQKEWMVPPRPSVKLSLDIVEWCTTHAPKFHGVSISGYHIREAGATGVEELAFTLADGLAYVEELVGRGLDVDDFAPRLSFFWDVHNDFFEEIAKFRAARRIWARQMRDRFGAKKPKSLMLRTHAQTAGVTLTAQQPLNNVVRVTLQALAAVLGGTQSLHTNSLDETYALPTEEAVTVALRTQQIIAEESGVDAVVDPLGGSYYVETLTDQVEVAAMEIIERIDAMGGMIAAVEAGFPQKCIAESAFRFQQQVEAGERTIVGVNKYQVDEDTPIPILKIDPEVERRQVERLRQVREQRDPERVAAALEKVRNACDQNENAFDAVLEAVEAYATVGEICDVFRQVYGVYSDPAYL